MRASIGYVAALLLMATPAIAQTPPPVEAFGRLPAVADVAISPDGHSVAMALSSRSGDGAIVIANLDAPSSEH